MSGRLITGLVLIVVGTLFLLGEFGVVDRPGSVLAAWWPLILVGIGAGQAIQQRRLAIGPLVIMGVGLFLLVVTSDLVAVRARVIWPLGLVAVGVWLLVRPSLKRGKSAGAPDSRLGLTAVFEDRNVRSSARAFEQASLTSIFGDVELDLREAGAGGQEMVVDVSVIFGDVDVYVPKGWRVLLTAGSLFARVEHRPGEPLPPPEGPLLQVRGFTIFGDVTVRQ